MKILQTREEAYKRDLRLTARRIAMHTFRLARYGLHYSHLARCPRCEEERLESCGSGITLQDLFYKPDGKGVSFCRGCGSRKQMNIVNHEDIDPNSSPVPVSHRYMYPC